LRRIVISALTADQALAAQLGKLRGLTEVRTGDGKALGFFMPPMPREKMLLYLKVLTEHNPAEIERRKREEAGKGCSLQDDPALWSR
jgi:hypothetical protein